MFTVKELFLHHYLLGSEFMFTVKELFSSLLVRERVHVYC